MNKVILHLGLHKTASSSFQQTCYKNTSLLKSQGVLYPVFECIENGVKIVNHSISIFSLFTENSLNYHINQSWGLKRIKAVNSEYARQLKRYLRQNKTVVLSGEDISSLSPSELQSFSDFLDEFVDELEVVALIRSPYQFFCSATQEKVKGGVSVKFDDFAPQIHIIDKLLDFFAGKIKIFSFAKACNHEQGPVGFLLDHLKVDYSDFKFVSSNKGNSNEFVRVQNLLNGHAQKSKTESFPLVENSTVAKTKFLLTDAELEVILPALKKENELFEKKLGKQFCDPSFPTSKPLSHDEQLIYLYSVLREPIRSLSTFSVNILRDTAIKNKSLDARSAYEILSLAHHARPEGSFIKSKLIELKRQIK